MPLVLVFGLVLQSASIHVPGVVTARLAPPVLPAVVVLAAVPVLFAQSALLTHTLTSAEFAPCDGTAACAVAAFGARARAEDLSLDGVPVAAVSLVGGAVVLLAEPLLLVEPLPLPEPLLLAQPAAFTLMQALALPEVTLTVPEAGWLDATELTGAVNWDCGGDVHACAAVWPSRKIPLAPAAMTRPRWNTFMVFPSLFA